MGKYLKARTAGNDGVAGNGKASDYDSTKKRKADVSGVEYKNFSGW